MFKYKEDDESDLKQLSLHDFHYEFNKRVINDKQRIELVQNIRCEYEHKKI